MSARRRMQRLLDVRRHEESVARQAYAVALRREQDAADEVARERSALEGAQQELRSAQGGRLEVARWRSLLARAGDHEALLLARRDVLVRRAEERRRAEEAWRQARQRERSIEKLDERRAEEAARAARLREQKTLDEVGLRRFANADRSPEGGVG